MINQAYETIDKIVLSRKIPFLTLVVELYDMIFQKDWSPRHQKKLFVYAMIRLDDCIYESEMPDRLHLFTAYIKDNSQELSNLSEDDTKDIFISLATIKECYKDDIVRAMLSLYDFLMNYVPYEYRYVTFCAILRSGFVPFDQPHLNFTYGKEDRDLLELAIHRLSIMNWLCDQNEYALVTYALNLINEHRDYSMIQHAILVKLSSMMKGKGFEGCFSQIPRQQEVGEVSYDGLASNLRKYFKV